MRNKIILFSGLLLVFVIGMLLVASLYFATATKSTAEAVAKVNAFAVWQEPTGGEPGPVHATVEITDNPSNPLYTHAEGGTITLVRASGEPILTSGVGNIDMIEECDPREGIVKTRYAFDMLPASVAPLNEGEVVAGTMILKVQGRDHVFPLPERQVSIHP